MTYIKNILLIVLFFAAVIALGHYAVITILIGFFLNFLYECYEVFILKKEPQKPTRSNDSDDDYALPTLIPSKPVDTADTDLIAFRYLKTRYLHSPEWQLKRKQALTRAHYQCEQCSDPNNLEVHHRVYHRIPHESLSDLVVLCRSCHQAIHDKYGYPKTYKDYMQWNH